METMDDNDAIIRIHNKYLNFVKQYDDTNNESLLPPEEFLNKKKERSFHIRNIYAEQFGKRTFYDDTGGEEAENLKNFYILKNEDKYEINYEGYTLDGTYYNFEEKWKKLINFIYERYLNKRHDNIKDTPNASIIKGLHNSIQIDTFINHLEIYSDWLMFFFIYESLYAVNEENKNIFMDLAIYLNNKNTIPMKNLMDKTGTLKILAEKYDDEYKFLKKLMPEETLIGFTPSTMYIPVGEVVNPYDLATEEDDDENNFREIEEEHFGGGRKKTRRKKHKKTKNKTKRDKTKRDKTKKKNKKRTRRMKRRT